MNNSKDINESSQKKKKEVKNGQILLNLVKRKRI